MMNSAFSNKLFEAIFGAPERKELKLELYNALRESDYTDADEIEFARAEDSFYLGRDYDIPFLLHGNLDPYEQEDKKDVLAPCMAMYMYLCAMHCLAGRMTDDDWDSDRIRIYPSALIALYNGPDHSQVPSVHFEDNFVDSNSGSLKVRVHVEDIRNGGELDLAKKCKPLADYAAFMRSFCDSRDAGTDMTVAIAKATQELPDGAVRQYLMSENIMVLSEMLDQDEDEE